ncbi:MAG TPA: ABC transporter substrate-binding protein [Gemmatimonadaceae bacterium]|nr:ABC transporter substrate-binding protein [Gemmatimonadaceae bacterium]
MAKLLFFALLLSVAGCSGKPKPYTVGAAGPWNTDYGLENLQGVRLAVEEINRAGGINGRLLRVIEKDDAGTGAGAAGVAEEFIAQPDVAAVIGHVNSSGTLASARVYDGELAAVATSASSPDLSGISKWVFRVISSDSLNGVAMAQFASTLGAAGTTPTASVLYENNTYGRGLADAFRRSFRGTLISMDPINADLPTAEPYISFLKPRNPDILFVAGRVASGLKIIHEARRQGFNPVFLGGDGWQGIVTDTAAAEGAYIGMSFTPEDPTPAARAFVAAFRKKFNTVPDAHVALAYDATMLIAQALRERGDDRKAIRDYLAGLTAATAYPGLTGPVYFEKTGDPVGIRFRVFKVQRGLLTVPPAGT